MNILITSAGRRNYLVDWFQNAASDLSGTVRVITADGDPAAPAMGTGDASVVLPRIESPEYIDAVFDACRQHDIQLLLSVNDYDIATLSCLGLNRFGAAGVTVAVPPPTTLKVVEDKVRTGEVLRSAGIEFPATTTADAIEAIEPSTGTRWVIKHRYGSGSSGLFIAEGPLITHALALSGASAPNRSGLRPDIPDPQLVVVQEAIKT